MPREYQYPFELRHLVYFREVARQIHFAMPLVEDVEKGGAR